jgi:hypothetical protein
MFIEKLMRKPGALEAHGRLSCGNAAGLSFAHYLIKHQQRTVGESTIGSRR